MCIWLQVIHAIHYNLTICFLRILSILYSAVDLLYKIKFICLFSEQMNLILYNKSTAEYNIDNIPVSIFTNDDKYFLCFKIM